MAHVEAGDAKEEFEEWCYGYWICMQAWEEDKENYEFVNPFKPGNARHRGYQDAASDLSEE